MKILHVDDHSLLLEGVRNILLEQDPGLTIVGAACLRDALEAARLIPDLDVVLLDLGLPDSSGRDTVLRFRETFPAPRCVVLSGSEDTQTLEECFDAGAVGFISKAIHGASLVQAIRRVVGGGVYWPAHFRNCETHS